MTGPGDQNAAAVASHGRLRASHADREHVIDALKAAFVQGRLTKAEFDLRVGQALASRTYADLAALTADIPAGVTGAQPPRNSAQVQAGPPPQKVARPGTCVAVAAAVLVVASVLTGGYALVLFVPFYFIALLVAGAQMLDSRHPKRSRGQLPPGPAQRGQALDAEPDDRLGDDLILFAARNDAGARRLAGHRVVQRTWRSLPVH